MIRNTDAAQGIAFQKSVLCVGAHGPHMWVLEWNRETVDSLVHLEVDEMERSSVALSDVMISPSGCIPPLSLLSISLSFFLPFLLMFLSSFIFFNIFLHLLLFFCFNFIIYYCLKNILTED